MQFIVRPFAHGHQPANRPRSHSRGTRAGGYQTKRAVVEQALREYVQRRKQLKIVELFGTIEYDDDYDYKEQRRRK
ncbi:type II toxin-antitoxin system VapB family antitoxin [Calidithermus roseus]|uniref:type II toxin-antitoxin system VapB family antitoxin n=1 Tax=Calidithermus roseus TaxID=1644118 RepID=UPI001C71054A